MGYRNAEKKWPLVELQHKTNLLGKLNFALFFFNFLSTKTCYSSNLPQKKSLVIYWELKLAIFYQFFIFSTNDSPSKTMKNAFSFHLKNSFCSLVPGPFCF